MSHPPPICFEAFAAFVADTFDAPPDSVLRATHCGDVPGWDSLGHSVLLARLDRRLGIVLEGSGVDPSDTVGEFFDRLHPAVPGTAG